jgi:hypothetical protein
VTPVIYLYLERFQEGRRSRAAARSAAAAPAGSDAVQA